jgi:DNA-binding phage protein
LREFKIDYGAGWRIYLAKDGLEIIVLLGGSSKKSQQRDIDKAQLEEAVTLFLNGDADTAKAILGDLVNATVGFEQLAAQVEKPPKSLHRMLSKSGNQTMSNLAAIFSSLKTTLRMDLQTNSMRLAA